MADAAKNSPPPLTESGLADRFLLLYTQDFRYCESLDEWFGWTGSHWEANPKGYLQRGLKHTLRDVRERAIDQRMNHCIPLLDRAEKRGARENILALARHEARRVTLPELDADVGLLNCLNGTLDLRTGKLHPHEREDLITHMTHVDWQPEAACPLWESFVSDVCGGDAELMRYLQRCVGYTLTGDVREQVVFLLWGDGANGKSTFLLTLLHLLGTYAQPADVGLLTRASANDDASLYRSRLVVLPETPEGQRLNESRLKALSGGDHVVGGGARVFRPTHKLWIATNHLPEIRGTEYAIWRRLSPVPFKVRIESQDQDKKLLWKLCQELPGILRWAVTGCDAWRSEGLNPPASILAATEEYRVEQDRVAAFIGERCEIGKDKTATAKELYEAYTAWAEGNGELVLPHGPFGKRLAQAGFIAARVGAESTRVWRGLGVAQNAADKTDAA